MAVELADFVSSSQPTVDQSLEEGPLIACDPGRTSEGTVVKLQPDESPREVRVSFLCVAFPEALGILEHLSPNVGRRALSESPRRAKPDSSDHSPALLFSPKESNIRPPPTYTAFSKGGDSFRKALGDVPGSPSFGGHDSPSSRTSGKMRWLRQISLSNFE